MILKKFLKLEHDLANDKIEEVLKYAVKAKYFKGEQNEVSLLKGRLKSLKKGEISGIISYDESTKERNKIRASALELVKTTKRKFVTEDEESYYFTQDKINSVITETERLYYEIYERGEDGYNWISKFKSSIDDINKKWKNQNFTVAIIALMKSGKSTLLNAWMGNEYLSANLKPETMRVVRILHDSKSEEGVLTRKGRTISKGAEEIRLKLSKLNKKARESDSIPQEEELRLKVNLPAFKDKNFKGINFELLDTPGVNEAGVQSLEAKVNRLVESSDVIIYLLDLSKLKSEDEEKMFKKLKDERDELFGEIKTKLFFVVNKIDMIENRNFGEAKGFNSELDVKDYIIDYLKNNTSISLNQDELFLVSAEKAVLGRVLHFGIDTEKQRNDFLKMAYGTKRRRELPEEHIMLDAKEFIEESGISNLEDKILSRIHSKRINIFVTSIIFKLENLLEQVQRNIEVSKGALDKKVVQIDTLKKDINRIHYKLTELTQITSNFKKKGDESITNFFYKFENDIIASIKDTFSGTDKAKRDNLLPKKIAEFLHRTNYSIKTENKQEIDRAVNELHLQVIKSLDSNFKLLWDKILKVIHKYHKEQSIRINKTISPLVKQIEEKINEELNINLKPNIIETPALPLDEFYKKIGSKVFNLINKKRKFSPRFEKKKKVAKKDKKFLWWTIRKKGDVYEVTEFKLFKNQFSFSSYSYQSYLIKQVKKLTANTEEIAKNIVQSQFEKVKIEIEEEVMAYSSQYINIIEDEIKKKQDGIDIEQRKETINSDLTKTINLIDGINEIK